MSKLAEVRPAHWIAGALLAITVAVPLLVTTYAREEPYLWGFPFFYWYQLLWVFIAAGTVSIAFRLIIREERKRRAAQGLSDPDKKKEGPAA
ncbi:DUF3311 domain-containing protein [Kribbella deserti]|uniref:DUF3311 domain-containing protein n=1 Tax=Kribbella deserti TaxID=1926257 RepID=A0ABV6QS67_9ACTN